MEKTVIALHRNNQGLSNADFKLSFDKINSINRFIRKIKDTDREVERERYLKSIKSTYKYKVMEIENLKLAYDFLLNKKNIEILPILEKDTFLEVVEANFSDLEITILSYKIQDYYEILNDRINKVTSFDNPALYYDYHYYDKNFETITCSHNGKSVSEYGAYVPNYEMVEMQTERDKLLDLFPDVEKLALSEVEEGELEIIGRALA